MEFFDIKDGKGEMLTNPSMERMSISEPDKKRGIRREQGRVP